MAAGEIAEVFPPRLTLVNVGGDIGRQRAARLLQTGDEDEEDGEDDAQKQHHGQRQADRALQLGVPAAAPLGQRPIPQALQPHHHQIQYKGDAHADEQRRQQGKQVGKKSADGGDIVQAPEQQHRKGDEQHDPLHGFFVQLQGIPRPFL